MYRTQTPFEYWSCMERLQKIPLIKTAPLKLMALLYLSIINYSTLIFTYSISSK